MAEMNQAIYNHPQWVQPKFNQRYFELRSNDLVIAKLQFQSPFGSLASAASASDTWTFKRVGFFNPRVTVRKESEELDIAVYRPRWTGADGIVVLDNGRKYHWKTANFWATEYVFLDQEGTIPLRFHQGIEEAKLADVFKIQARVEVDSQMVGNPDLPLLVLLGFYLIILQQEDSAAATAAIG